ncbi:hypothetical protein E1161_01230 [Saccharopolyspora aridisoli]|uniref:Uncharacterized protein n=1 Tax=Saccharopolyspora aridisoli TaxID=2530385 RepID=A0A4R4UW94_9PSEU|nr:hypothetical protein [Saccharopolyspora aridisoli]TDC96868.1 hypothetical protein E1161_01230 [Saccharopolyspora aridisoli]
MLGYTTAAVLAVIAATSAHYSQTRADEVAMPEPANAARAQASAPSRQYLPQLMRPESGLGTPPVVPPPAPTAPAMAGPQTAVPTSEAPEETTTRSYAPSTTTEPTSTPSATSEPTPTSEPTGTSESTQTSPPTQSSEPSQTSEPTQPSTTSEPKPGLLPLVGGVVDGLTGPLLGS